MDSGASPVLRRTRMFANLLRIVVLLALAFPATYSVLAAGPWYVAPTGSDSNSCTAVESPCLTIHGAIAKASAGDTINVAVGIYTGTGSEVVLIDKDITLLGGWNAAFTTQSGLSTVDGETARGGMRLNSGQTAVVERFKISNGYSLDCGVVNVGTLTLSDSLLTGNRAQGICNYGTLTVTDSVVAGNMNGGIDNHGTLTVDRSSIRGNTFGDWGSGGGGAGGIQSDGGIVTVSNSTISGNKMLGHFSGGSAIYVYGQSFTLNNTTVSGNSGAKAISVYGGSLILNNSTVTRNTGGIYRTSGSVTLRNSILAGNANLEIYNKTYDCTGFIASAGYNLIGNNTGCKFSAAAGDKVGTAASPLDARLFPLAGNGGSTFTHALAGNSPALNAGNPVAPGSETGACLVTDQRGVARPVDARCDMGAYEGHFAMVASITRADANPTSASSVRFTVKFTEAVTHVDKVAPFSDFNFGTPLVPPGLAITGVSGTGAIYTVTVKTGQTNLSFRLNLGDQDSIRDGSGNPLGGPGAGNADFAGPAYTVRKIPTPLSPAGITTWDTTPTFQWTNNIPAATQYQFQIWRGTTLVYTRSVLAASCAPADCSYTLTSLLIPSLYKWRVRAAASGIWQPFSVYKSFTVLAPKAGYWKSSWTDFYVTPDLASVKNFSIYISVTGCGNYKITHTALAPIVNGKFSFSGSFYAQGIFASTGTSATGTAGLSSFLVPGCGYVSGGPFPWTATWNSPSLPEPGVAIELLPLPGAEGTFPGPFIIEPLKP